MDDPRGQALQEHCDVGTFDCRQFLDVFVDDICQAVKVTGPLTSRQARPAVESLDSRTDRGIGRECVPTGDVGEFPVPIERRPHLESRLRADPPTAYVMVGRNCNI